jgi:hypothetical protein
MPDSELHILIEKLEAQIEELDEIVEGCRKWILLSKVAMAAGGIWLLANLAGLARFDPALMVLAIAATLGGMVLAGSNASTLRRAGTAIKAAQALRAKAIDEADLSVVGGDPEPRRIQ